MALQRIEKIRRRPQPAHRLGPMQHSQRRRIRIAHCTHLQATIGNIPSPMLRNNEVPVTTHITTTITMVDLAIARHYDKIHPVFAAVAHRIFEERCSIALTTNFRMSCNTP